MEDIVKNVIDKVSSYNIFNNFFPGIIFCYIVENFTRFSFGNGEVWEKLFLYYFIGTIISRMGSIIVEKLLKSIKVKNKKSKIKEPFLKFALYSDYVEASENDAFIKTLNETNNMYRTIIAVLIAITGVKLYEWLLCDFINRWGRLGHDIMFISVCILIIVLFIHSYRKQTAYIKSRVEKYIDSKQKK